MYYHYYSIIKQGNLKNIFVNLFNKNDLQYAEEQ